MAKCMLCGASINWNGDFMKSDFDGEKIDSDDDQVVNCCTCPKCEAEIEVWHLSPNEEKSWKPIEEDTYGAWECFNCGGEVELIKETTRNDYEGFDFDPDMNNKISIFRCKSCGAQTIYFHSIEK